MVRRYPVCDLGDEDVHVVCVGDGNTPRTGALFAYRSHWTVHSVDPRLNAKPKFTSIRRLTLHQDPIQDFHVSCDQAIIVAVHSHAPLEAAMRAVDARDVLVVAMPCCVEQTLDAPPVAEYADWGVHSPKRTIKVWRIPR